MKAKRKQRAVKVYGVWYADSYCQRMSLYGALHRTPAGAVAHAKLLIRAKLSSDYRWRRERKRKPKVPTNVYARWLAYDPRTGEKPHQPVVIYLHDLVR